MKLNCNLRIFFMNEKRYSLCKRYNMNINKGGKKLNKIKLFLVFLILFIPISAVSADGNFTSLQTDIVNSGNSIDITQDYTYDEKTDTGIDSGIVVNKTNFVINGNGHTLNGNNQSRIFHIVGDNVTINNLKFVFGNGNIGGSIVCDGVAIINNCTFLDNYASTDGGAIVFRTNGTVIDSIFTDNYSPDSAAIGVYGSSTIINSSTFKSSINIEKGYISGEQASIIVDNSVFTDTVSKYAAIISSRETLIQNSKFINLKAKESGGAIILKEIDDAIINNCTFINVSSEKNAGAVLIDAQGFKYKNNGTVMIHESEFINCSSMFGGAVVLLGGNASISNSNFINNKAVFDGGAVYTSFNSLKVVNTLFEDNGLTFYDKNNAHGGAIHADVCELEIYNSKFSNNRYNAIYAYDSSLMANATFLNNTEAVHGVFLSKYSVIYNTDTKDEFIFNDTNYPAVVIGEGAKLEFLNDTIVITKLPSKFNSDDWGWVSSIKDQGADNSCWAFGTVAALESALLKATGIQYDFSENNVQNTMIKYSKYGGLTSEGGDIFMAALYALNWFGMIPTDDDTYDEYGKLPMIISSKKNIHLQDAVLINPRSNVTDNENIKRAIVEYGAITTGIKSVGEPYYNTKTGAQYYNNVSDVNCNHIIAVVGWDDTYSKDNFLITPPGDGGWIVKNSYGSKRGVEGFDYVSYYDLTLFTEPSMGYLFDNSEAYDANYQYDFGGELELNKTSGVTYRNEYTCVKDGYVGAIGSWFEEDSPFIYKVYVNGELKLNHTEKSLFTGYHTVVLYEYIPVEEGDKIAVELTNTMMPLVEKSRIHYEANKSFILQNDKWFDLANIDRTAALKVYTQSAVEGVETDNMVKVYRNGTKFETNISVLGAEVVFEINGKNYTRKSNDKGIASIDINLSPNNYTIKTKYNGKVIQNDIEVLPTLIGDNLVKYYCNGSQFYVELIDAQCNPVANTRVTMNINGVFYDRTTNEKGIARLNINLNPGEYILTALDPFTGLQMSYNITVLPVLNASDLNMTYKDGSKFAVSLVDGQGKALANATVTFNINGVFYNRTTDANGTARLNINLIAGEYIITSQYESAVISNTITIAAKEE